MKRSLVIVPTILLFFVSCKKEKSPPVPDGHYYVTAKLNGIATSFNTIVGASRGDATRSPHLLFVTGRSGAVQTWEIQPSLHLVLNDDAPLTHRTYVSGADPVHAGYSASEMNPYNADPGFEIKITQLTPNEIRGSFNGKLTGAGGDTVEIKDGVFFVPIR
jgi:hypothetical protein